MTARRVTCSVTAVRPSRRLVITFTALLVAVIAVWCVVGYDLGTQARYAGPGQEEIDARREAVRLAPRDPGALLALAYAYQQVGRYDDALFAYEAVLEVLPVETAALYNKGVILLELGDAAGAEDAWRTALEISPGHTLSAAALGRRLAAQGKHEAVLEVVLPVIELRPSAAQLHYLAGEAYENLGDPNQATLRYRLALEHHPDFPEAREALERLGGTP